MAARGFKATCRRLHTGILSSPAVQLGLAHGNDVQIKPLWDILYYFGADVVIGGHDHDYERFAPQDPNGKADPQHGIREFVVGSGGKNSHRLFAGIVANSEAHQADPFGVLKLTLHPQSYDWQFVAEEGKTFRTLALANAINSVRRQTPGDAHELRARSATLAANSLIAAPLGCVGVKKKGALLVIRDNPTINHPR